MKAESSEAISYEEIPTSAHYDQNRESSPIHQPRDEHSYNDDNGERKFHPNLKAIPSALQTDLDSIKNKPWNEEGADITDYFNYGFDEEMFKIYQAKVRDNFHKLDIEDVQNKLESSGLKLDHKLINFILPHECGGCGEPKGQEYARVNTYKVVEDEAPVLCNKSQGYFVKITKNGLQNIPDNPLEEGEGDYMAQISSMFPLMSQEQIQQFYQNLMLGMQEQYISPDFEGEKESRRPRDRRSRRRHESSSRGPRDHSSSRNSRKHRDRSPRSPKRRRDEKDRRNRSRDRKDYDKYDDRRDKREDRRDDRKDDKRDSKRDDRKDDRREDRKEDRRDERKDDRRDRKDEKKKDDRKRDRSDERRDRKDRDRNRDDDRSKRR